MGEIARGVDGRRLFTPEFKKQQIERVLRDEISLPELTRKLDVSPSVTRRWKQLLEQGSTTAVDANEDVVPTRQFRHTEARIRTRDEIAAPIPGRTGSYRLSSSVPRIGGRAVEPRP